METVRFIGHLYPRGTVISATFPEIDWKWEEKDLVLHFKTNINNSIINVECSLEQYKKEYFNELYARSLDLARTASNLTCFANGVGVVAVFEFVIFSDGVPGALRIGNASLSQHVKSYSLNPIPTPEMQKIADVVVKDPALFRALNDLIEAITFPRVAPVNCGRVLDSIRRQMVPDLDKAKAWEALGEALNVARPYREYISQQSTGPRHGDPAALVSGDVSGEVLKRTWIIMDRYLEYRKRGNVNLTAPEFPELA